MFFKIGVLKNFAKFTGKHLCNFINKETPTQVFSCEFCEIFKNTVFHRTLPLDATGFFEISPAEDLDWVLNIPPC